MKNILNKIDYINPTDKKTQEKLKDFSVDKLYEYSKKTNNFKIIKENPKLILKDKYNEKIIEQ